MLAAGEGRRLQPLTRLRPKPLCPVAGVTLVDRAITQVQQVTAAVAVNVHHGRALLEAHLAGRVHLSVEEPRALGTAGAIGHLRDWVARRPLLAVNADTWHDADLAAFVAVWDGDRPAVLVAGATARFGPTARIVASLTPWSEAARLPTEPAGLYEALWVRRHRARRLQVVATDCRWFDCGTPRRYLDANLAVAAGDTSRLIGTAAIVEGDVMDSVVWPGAVVRPGERLVRAIRAAEHVTVLVR